MQYRALIKRKADGLERWSPWYECRADDIPNPGLIIFDWRDNNFSCDCNRHLAFATNEEAEDVDCGDEVLYSVLRIETDDGRIADEDARAWVLEGANG